MLFFLLQFLAEEVNRAIEKLLLVGEDTEIMRMTTYAVPMLVECMGKGGKKGKGNIKLNEETITLLENRLKNGEDVETCDAVVRCSYLMHLLCN